MERWKTLQERRCVKDSLSSYFDTAAEDSRTEDKLPIDSIIVTDSQQSLSVQTDLTMLELHLLEHDYQKNMEELHVLQECNLGYPSGKQLEATPELLIFYTGLINVLLSLWHYLNLLPRTLLKKGNTNYLNFNAFC